jgi:hypothetical protein
MDRILALSVACHQALYASTTTRGEPCFVWEELLPAEQSAMRHAIRFWEELDVNVYAFDKLCEIAHVAWMHHKQRGGWTWGPSMEPFLKTHPGIVPYDQVPEKYKDQDRVVMRCYLSMRRALPCKD